MEISLFRPGLQKFLGNLVGFDVINREVFIRYISDKIFRISIIIENLQQSARHLKVTRPSCFDENDVHEIQSSGLGNGIIRIFVNENQ